MAGLERDALLGNTVPHLDFQEVTTQIQCITRAIDQGIVLASHDISDGGLLFALFEMMVPQRKIGGKIGLQVDLDALESTLRSDTLLFTQTGGFLLEVSPENEDAITQIAKKAATPLVQIGSAVPSPVLTILRGKETLLSQELQILLQPWETGLQKAL